MKRLIYTIEEKRSGYTLFELITVLVIGTMIIITAMTVYNRVRSAAAAIDRNLETNTLATEILQRIVEDIDRMAIAGTDTTLVIRNKLRNRYNITQMTLENKIYDKSKKPRTFAKVIWQTSYDPFEDALTIYRSHSGIAMEDRLFETSSDSTSRLEKPASELFVPLANVITYFKIEAIANEKPTDVWSSASLPKAVRISISFAEPFENMSGQLEVWEEDIITRTVAIDRTRAIKYVFVDANIDGSDLDDTDPNNLGLNDFGDDEGSSGGSGEGDTLEPLTPGRKGRS